jgi:hypothetical protein
VSLLLRNELRIRVSAQACEAQVWHAGWARRPAAVARVVGGNDGQLEQTLDALLDQGQVLPRRAAISVADEFLYFAVLPASGSGKDAQAQARDHFAESLGDEELLVSVQLSPDNGRWLAVALPVTLLETWRHALATLGVTVRSISAGLFDDLWHWQVSWPKGDELIVLRRDQGVMCLGVLSGAVHSIGWERCDVSQVEVWCARVQACAERLAAAREEASADDPIPVTLMPADEDDAQSLRTLSASLGWQVLSRDTATP